MEPATHGDKNRICLHTWRRYAFLSPSMASLRRCPGRGTPPVCAHDRARSPHRPRPRHQCAVHTVMLAVSTDTVSTSRGAPSWYSDASFTTNGLALGPHASNLSMIRDLTRSLRPSPVTLTYGPIWVTMTPSVGSHVPRACGAGAGLQAAGGELDAGFPVHDPVAVDGDVELAERGQDGQPRVQPGDQNPVVGQAFKAVEGRRKQFARLARQPGALLLHEARDPVKLPYNAGRARIARQADDFTVGLVGLDEPVD